MAGGGGGAAAVTTAVAAAVAVVPVSINRSNYAEADRTTPFHTHTHLPSSRNEPREERAVVGGGHHVFLVGAGTGAEWDHGNKANSAGGTSPLPWHALVLTPAQLVRRVLGRRFDLHAGFDGQLFLREGG